MWDYSNGAPAPYQKKKGWFPKWPDPFANQVKDIDILACEGEWLAAITMANNGFGAWFFSQFIPQPTEIARKWILGSYKCGFFLTGKRKSPLDIIWRNGDLSKFLARISVGLTTSAFVFWGAQTVWEGLSTWHTLMYASEKCDRLNNEVVARDAFNVIPLGSGVGGLGAYTVVWNPKDYFAPVGGGLTVLPGFTANVTAFGRILCDSGSIGNVRLYLHDGVSDTNRSTVDSGPMQPGDIFHYELATASFVGPAVVDVGIEWTDNDQAPFVQNNAECIRYVAQVNPIEEPCKSYLTAMATMSGQPFTPGLLE